MRNKIVKGFAFTIVFFTLLSIGCALVRNVTLYEREYNPLIKNSICFLSTFPFTVKDVLCGDELKGIPPTYVKIDPAFEEVNNLDYDLYGTNSFYNKKTKEWDIKLFNFRNDSVIYKWHIQKKDFYKTEKQFTNAEPRSTILLPDKSVIVLFAETNNLFRLDSLSNIIWHNTQKQFHHTMNLSVDSNIWVCSSSYQAIKNPIVTRTRYYIDDYITKVNINTGEIIQEKSITKLLTDNDLQYMLFKYGNYGYGEDPIHLNDIEVAYKKSASYNKGDLFLSCRHRSVIIQYRPVINKVIRVIDGPFINQHDVDIISDNEISLFNNNVIAFGTCNPLTPKINTENKDVIEFNSSYVLKYNIAKDEYSSFSPEIFEKEEIASYTEGLQDFLSNGDLFIESQNEGKIYILNEKEIKLKKYFKTDIKGMAFQPHWIRLYEDINFLNIK